MFTLMAGFSFILLVGAPRQPVYKQSLYTGWIIETSKTKNAQP
jgi:hypothetical protein